MQEIKRLAKEPFPQPNNLFTVDFKHCDSELACIFKNLTRTQKLQQVGKAIIHKNKKKKIGMRIARHKMKKFCICQDAWRHRGKHPGISGVLQPIMILSTFYPCNL